MTLTPTPTLAELIQTFVREEVPHFESACEAYAACDTTTDRFIRYCENHGIEGLERYTFEADPIGSYVSSCDDPNPAPDIYIVRGEDGQLLSNEAGKTMCTWHCVVDAGECLIDFTSRQYQTESHRMEFPLIIPMNRAMAAHA